MPNNPMADRVRVYAPLTRDECGTVPAQVGWGGSMPTTANEARHMANALLDAADACDQINYDAKVKT